MTVVSKDSIQQVNKLSQGFPLTVFTPARGLRGLHARRGLLTRIFTVGSSASESPSDSSSSSSEEGAPPPSPVSGAKVAAAAAVPVMRPSQPSSGKKMGEGEGGGGGGSQGGRRRWRRNRTKCRSPLQRKPYTNSIYYSRSAPYPGGNSAPGPARTGQPST